MTAPLPFFMTRIFGKWVNDMKLSCMPMGPVQANCYTVIDEETKKAAVIDPGDYTQELKNLLHSEKIEELEYILLTHGHFDHILGVAKIKKDFPNAKVCIHSADSEFLLNDRLSLASASGIEQTYLNCDISLKEGSVIELGSTEIRVIHTPGHTPGGVCYIDEKEKILFSGDTIFCRTVGRTDFPGGDFDTLFESLKKIRNLKGDYVIYPGHNRSTTLEEEREKNRYMRKIK